jgi:hypothetical protein
MTRNARRWMTRSGAQIELAHKAHGNRWADAAGLTVEVISISLGRTPADEGQWFVPRLPNGRTASTRYNLRGWVRTLDELAEAGVDVASLAPDGTWVLTVTGPDGGELSSTDLGRAVDEGQLAAALEAVGAVRRLPAAA